MRRVAAISTLLLLVSAASPAPDLSEAMRRLQSGDAAGAVAIAEAVTAAQPTNGRAWRVLGIAATRAKQYDKALSANLRALEVEPSMIVPLYNIGVVYALQQQPDKAFEWLQKAKATGRIDMTQIAVDNDLASLRSDPRFEQLLPNAEAFAKPFVEDVKIVREWDGESPRDQFGWIARNIGDVDGDGVPDVVTSAPSRNNNAGRVYVFSTASGKLLWTADGKPNDQLGLGVEGAGDVNGDGIPDVIASAPGAGTAMVYSGRDGHVLHTLKGESGENFGRHVAAAGDVDRDGHADVIVGAPGKGAGHAYVFSGRNGHVLLTLTGEHDGDQFGSTVAGGKFLIAGAPGAGASKHGRTYVYDRLSTKPKFTIDSDETGAALGQMFVSVLGDADGDGVPDIYASDWSNAARGARTGRIYVHSGKTGRRLLTLTGETAGEGFGIGPATAGDVDGDGRADLIVGSWQYSESAISGGRATLFSGRDGHVIKTYTCRIPGDTFGFDAVGMGDVDRDGTIDFLITSAWSGIHGFHSGRMFIISSGVGKNQDHERTMRTGATKR